VALHRFGTRLRQPKNTIMVRSQWPFVRARREFFAKYHMDDCSSRIRRQTVCLALPGGGIIADSTSCHFLEIFRFQPNIIQDAAKSMIDVGTHI
jgi:hypothetical protein